jgi:LytS/YehU family sensor histidine kinase
LQQTRFVSAFNYDLTVDTAIQAETIKIPSLLLQPIVENAINHGLLPKESGHLSITIERGEAAGSIRCKIEDNGIGREASRAKKHEDPKESYGGELIRELIAIFNRYERTNITIEYLDKHPPATGTIVNINIANPRQHG